MAVVPSVLCLCRNAASKRASCCHCLYCLVQTKGVKSIVQINPTDAAWYAAVGGAGAAVVGTLVVWPLMRRVLKKYDNTHDDIPKDAAQAGANITGEAYKTKAQDVEEDRCDTNLLA